MKFLVKVKVNLSTLMDFGKKLKNGELDRSCIRGDTYCLHKEPAIGYSIWEAKNKKEFNEKFKQWRQYYENVDINKVISPDEAMKLLVNKIQ